MRWVPLLALLLGVLLGPAAVAHADPLPPEERTAVEVGIPPSDFGIPMSRVYRSVVPIFDAHAISKYQVDGRYGLTDLGSKIWNGLTNAFLLVTAFAVKMAIRVLEWAFTLELIRDTSDHIDTALKAMASSLWDSRLIHVAISLAGMWAAWVGLVLRRTTQAVGIMVTVLVVVALASWSFAGGLTWAMRFANEASNQISGVVLTGVSRTIAPVSYRDPWTTTAAFTRAGEAIWTVMVAYPWALAEFGDIAVAQEYQTYEIPGDSILRKDQKDRQDFYDDLSDTIRNRDFSWWQPGAAVQRLVIAFLAMVVGLTFAGMLIALGIGVLAFQLLALVTLAFAPIVFLLALIFPHVGSYIMSKWATKVLGAVFMKVVLSAVLSLVMLFSLILFQVGASYGWAASSLLQMVLVAVVILKRQSLMGFLTDLPSRPEQALHRLSEWHEPAIVRAGRFAATGAVQGWMTSRWLRSGEQGSSAQAQRVVGAPGYRSRPSSYSTPDDTPPPAAPSLAHLSEGADEISPPGRNVGRPVAPAREREVSQDPRSRRRAPQRVLLTDTPRPRLTLVKSEAGGEHAS